MDVDQHEGSARRTKEREGDTLLREPAHDGDDHEGRREEELTLRAQLAESRFRDIERLVSDWIWETDRNFRFVFVSPRISELIGYHPREINGMDFFSAGELLPPTSAGARMPDISLRSPFREAPYRMKTRNGETRLFMLSGVPVFSDRNGTFLGFRGTARDVTGEVEARADASRSQARLKDAIESVSEGFILYDGNGRLVLCNRQIREYWYGIAHRFVPGTPLSTLVRASTRVVAFPDRATFIRAGARRLTLRSTGFEVQLKDGRWLRITDRPMSDGSTVSIHTDITAVKQREEALREAKNTAEAANRAKSAFLANVSHELRTPLNAIIGFSEIMRDGVLGKIGNPTYEEYVASVAESGYHLLGVINDILDVAKAEAGKLELEESDVHLPAVVASALRLVSERAQRQHVTLASKPLDALPILHADERRLKQILINLLSNAIKFTESGGTVEIRAGVEETGALFIAVADTGIGIAPEHLADAMMPFGQVDNKLNRKFHGTGLGLPLTRSLAELHGGSLELSSELGVGTVATVHFPKSRVRDPESSEGPSA